MIDRITRLADQLNLEDKGQNRTLTAALLIGSLNIIFAVGVMVLSNASTLPVENWFIASFFVFSGLFYAAGLLVWRIIFRYANDLLIILFSFQLLFYGLTTKGIGFLLGTLSVVGISIILLEVVQTRRFNLVMLLSGLFGLLLYLLDYFGPVNRFLIPEDIQRIVPFLIGIAFFFLLISVIVNFRSLNLAAKIGLPILALVFVLFVVYVVVINNYFDGLTQEIYILEGGKLTAGNSSLVNSIESRVANINILAGILLYIVVLLISGMVSFVLRPINRLEELAIRIQTGNLNVRSNVETQDEIRSISDGFNLLVFRLRQMMETLELRVEDRTSELTSKIENLKTTINDLRLLAEVTELLIPMRNQQHYLDFLVKTIFEKFHFSEVSLYMLDPKQEYAVMRASSSDFGKHMISRGYKINIHQDHVISGVIKNNKPHFEVENVNESTDGNENDIKRGNSVCYFPLVIKENLIGVIEFHANRQKLSEDDFSLYLQLASIAARSYDNVKQYNDILGLLEKQDFIHTGNNQIEWNKFVDRRIGIGYNYSYGAISEIESNEENFSFNDWEKLQDEGTRIELPNYLFDSSTETIPTSMLKNLGNSPSLTVPIFLGGELIGAFQLQGDDTNKEWAEEEVSLISAVAEQVGLALGYARLLEETRHHADRESKVVDLASRLHSSHDPSAILQVAVKELESLLQLKSARIVFSSDQETVDTMNINDSRDKN